MIRVGIFVDYHKEYEQFIENAHTDDFIAFSKNYNIFQESDSELYYTICNLIKNRLEKEGLSLEIVKPD